LPSRQRISVGPGKKESIVMEKRTKDDTISNKGGKTSRRGPPGEKKKEGRKRSDHPQNLSKAKWKTKGQKTNGSAQKEGIHRLVSGREGKGLTRSVRKRKN